MNDEKNLSKCSDLKCDNKSRVKSICNEYGLNLGNSRKSQKDIFNEAMKLKRFKSE